MKDLTAIRKQIDSVDAKLVKLYEERMKLAEEVAEYKISTGKKVFDKERESFKLDKVTSFVEGSFLKNGVRELFEQIMSVSRKRQYQLLTEHGVIEKPDFIEIKGLKGDKARIVFQGVEGANSEMAMKQYFGNKIESYNVETWRDAMEEIASGKADYAVLPIENSSAGIVSQNYDLLVEYDNIIVGEQIIKIDHCLLGLQEAKMEDIQIVYSHPQALMQCSKYLGERRDWDKHSVKNTAGAAKKVKEDGNIHQAAIASKGNAAIYGLQILKENFQDNISNCTRFIIVTGKKVFMENGKKISICFEIPHESGSLYHMLSHFIYNNLNLNKIESRPIQGRTWEYRFFIDFEGNLNDSAVQNALRGLEEETTKLKIFGNY